MRRSVHQAMLLAAAMAPMLGCSSSSSPEVAERNHVAEAEIDAVRADSATSMDSATGEQVSPPTSLPITPPGVSATAEHEERVEIAEGADSDAPGGYPTPGRDESNNSLQTASSPLNQEAGRDEATKPGPRSDGDDPAAPLIVSKVANDQEELPLNNGREESAKPIPEGQRVVTVTPEVDAESLDAGRAPNAKPGDQTASPAKVKPTNKPVTSGREKLSDLPESIQSLDKDGDGQLGLYEWPREKLAEFKTLDTNKDGFLTPVELVAAQKKASDSKTPSSDKKPAATSDKKSEEKESTRTGDSSEQDKPETPEAAAGEADANESSNADDKPAQGT